MTRSTGMSCMGADFCQELAGDSDAEFHRVYQGNPPTRIIGRSPNLALLADMSPLCTGHLLIVPNRHHLSFAEVIDRHEREIENFTRHAFGRYAETFGDPLILEHGSAAGIDGSACITHAHWHILPVKFDETHRVITRDGLASIELTGLGDLAAIGRGVPYYYCADRNSRRLYGVGQSMRRQYLRSVMGTLMGIPDPEWDYAVVVRKDLLRGTMARTAGWRLRGQLTYG
jgi:diadenosine tetraphosphate (Ap4A) HIT family hydrolase